MDQRTVTNPETFLERIRRQEADRQGRAPQWLQRARSGALYGTDAEGRPVVKDLTPGRAA